MGDDEYLRCIEADTHGRRSLSAIDTLALGMFLAAILWATLGFGSMPQDITVRDRCDLAEVHHFFDDQARPIFDQVIFYEWSPAKGRHQVQAWRLLKHPCQRPRRDYATGEYVARWADGEIDREVRAATFRETFSQWDPELHDREHLPKEKRRELSRR